MNRWKERAEARAAANDGTAKDEPEPLTEQELLVQIRDLLEKQPRAHAP